nr:Atu4866 domain-containing protein [Pelagibacterium lentulum]
MNGLSLVAAMTLAFLPQKGLAQMTQNDKLALMQQPADTEHPYAAMWITEDGRIRHNLLPGGRYDEARGTRESAYQGRYEVRGNYIYYWDDTGFTADGEFIDDVLYHAGMVLYRDGNKPE